MLGYIFGGQVLCVIYYTAPRTRHVQHALNAPHAFCMQSRCPVSSQTHTPGTTMHGFLTAGDVRRRRRALHTELTWWTQGKRLKQRCQLQRCWQVKGRSKGGMVSADQQQRGSGPSLSFRGKGKRYFCRDCGGKCWWGRDSHGQTSGTKTKRRRQGRNTRSSFSSCALIFWSSQSPTDETNHMSAVQRTLVGRAAMSTQSWAGKSRKWIWGPSQEKPAPQILHSPNTILFRLTVAHR